MPLDDAVVSGSHIFGTMGPYVMKFDAATGAFVDSVRVGAPALGTCRIAELGGTLYVSVANAPGAWWDANVGGSGLGIYSVNPTTLVAALVIDWWAVRVAGPSCKLDGPYALLGAGGLLWAQTLGANASWVSRIDLGGPTILDSGGGDSTMLPQQLATNGLHVFNVENSRIRWRLFANLTAFPDFNSGDLSPLRDFIGCAWSAVNSRLYVVCVNATLVQFNPADAGVVTYNLATIQAGVRPFRVRYNPFDSRVYIPCQNQDCVIRWNPAAGTGTLIAGLASPIDVVFTATKVWAVQNSTTPLVDITP